jgi:hypothetical protein
MSFVYDEIAAEPSSFLKKESALFSKLQQKWRRCIQQMAFCTVCHEVVFKLLGTNEIVYSLLSV